MQRLTKAHLDALVDALVAGGTKTAKGRTRRPWSAVSTNKTIDTWAMVLADAKRQGLVTRDVAEHVDHVAVPYKDIDTYSEEEVQKILAAIATHRRADFGTRADGNLIADALEAALIDAPTQLCIDLCRRSLYR